jgi:hypothetical protein
MVSMDDDTPGVVDGWLIMPKAIWNPASARS